jgi:hypothetical protein
VKSVQELTIEETKKLDIKEITVADMKRSNVPENFWYATLGSIPKHLPYVDKVISYHNKMEELLQQGVGLYLHSDDNQTGKTSIAVALLKRALRLRKTAYFSEAGSLKNALTRNEDFEESTLLDERLRVVDLLVIDDIGKEYRTSSGFAETTFENIMRDRIQANKSIIITSNMQPKEISKVYSESLAALLKGNLIPINISGYNWVAIKEANLKQIL